MSNPNDYRIIRVFFNMAFPGEDFDSARVILVPPGYDKVNLPDGDFIHLSWFCIINKKRIVSIIKIGYSKIRIGYSRKYKTIFIGDGSYKREPYSD